MSGFQSLVAIAAALVGGGGFGALYAAVRKTPSEVRLVDAERAKLFDDRYGELIAQMRTDLEVTRTRLDRFDDEVTDLRAQLAAARDDALAARTAEAAANTEVAKVRAQLAEALQRASEERHAMRNDFNAEMVAKDRKIRQLEDQVAALRIELDAFKAKSDPAVDGRRRSDPPLP